MNDRKERMTARRWRERLDEVQEDFNATAARTGPMHMDRCTLEMYLSWLKGRLRVAEIEEERVAKLKARRGQAPVTVADLTKTLPEAS